ncbi:hypothetical protein CDAR_425131 [Caerostris darwini]|uniref:Uncharacterized protein n=1 Tax=Caerostris darwini TaxID=1538125 RepID=A0AAV4X7W2_9ARAC|nr:hypothetical protein CDAR_425131 [Caerostris darwini]
MVVSFDSPPWNRAVRNGILFSFPFGLTFYFWLIILQHLMVRRCEMSPSGSTQHPLSLSPYPMCMCMCIGLPSFIHAGRSQINQNKCASVSKHILQNELVSCQYDLCTAGVSCH